MAWRQVTYTPEQAAERLREADAAHAYLEHLEWRERNHPWMRLQRAQDDLLATLLANWRSLAITVLVVLMVLTPIMFLVAPDLFLR